MAVAWSEPVPMALSRADIEFVRASFSGEKPPALAPPPGYRIPVGYDDGDKQGWYCVRPGVWQIDAYRIVRATQGQPV